MDDAKKDLTTREAAAWGTFEAAVNTLARDRFGEPILPDEWSVKDVLWHIAYWWEDCADMLEPLGSGGEWTERDGDTDQTNARVLAQGRAMTLEEVELGVARIRERMLRAWDAAPDDPRVAEEFGAETIEHYREHLDAIRAAGT
jgi:hypothetical protein